MFDKSRGRPGRGPAGKSTEASGFSVIAAGVTITGNIDAGNDLQIDGLIEGDVKCAHLVIGESGWVVGAITADQVSVAGKVDGPITATRAELLGTAQIAGDVNYQELRIELGARISGKLNWAQDRALKLVASDPSAG